MLDVFGDGSSTDGFIVDGFDFVQLMFTQVALFFVRFFVLFKRKKQQVFPYLLVDASASEGFRRVGGWLRTWA